MYLHQVKDEAAAPLRRGGYMEEIGEENLFATKGDAIAAIFEKLDRDRCYRCTQRIFSECEGIPSAEQVVDERGKHP